MNITAALLVIGDEILSGRTKDRNIGTLADFLTMLGIALREVRVVPDEESEIISAINALRLRYTYLFTTGGIGPTHDDITAESVAKAFGVSIDHDPRAIAMLRERYSAEDLNEARLRMARIPQGADLIPNALSKAPGFMLENVIVMAGVPSIMQVMLDAVAPRLARGAVLHSVSLEAGNLPEGIYARGLGEVAKANPGVAIGSYPSFRNGVFRNQIVLRSRDEAALEGARLAVEALLASLKADEAPL